MTEVERADLAADYVAKRSELPQLFTDRRADLRPQHDLKLLVRLFAAYQTSKGWRPPESATSLEGSGSLRVTPAMAAGVSKTLWSTDDVVRIVETWENSRETVPAE